MNQSERRDRRIENTLFGVSLFSFAYFYQASDQGTAARFDLIRALLEHRSLRIDDYWTMNTADVIKVGGHYYSVKAPGAAFTGLLPWGLVTWILDPSMLAHHAPMLWAVATYLTIVISVSLPVALLVLVMYRFAKALGATAGRAAAIALIMAFATILFPYATEMTGEPLAAVCLMTSFYLVFMGGDAIYAGFAGFLAGWAVLCDFPSALVAVALAGYALVKFSQRKQVIGFAIGAGLVATLLMLHNYAAFGAPFFMSYQGYKLPGNQQFPEQAEGFVGLTYPRLKLLWNVLVDPQRGLFFCNPVLLLAIPGLVHFWRRRKWRAESFLVLETIVAFALFNASFGESIVSWGGGTATGPRQMTPAVPFFALALAFLPPAYDYLMGVLAGLSAFYMLAAISTNPHLPYEYSNPLWQFALPHYFRGDFSFNRDSYFQGGNLFGDSVAFNLGKLIKIPPPLQLVLLWLVWTAAASELCDALRLWSSEQRATIGAVAVSLALTILFVPPLTAPAQQRLSSRAPHGLLARFYMGVNPTETPPHLVRVDATIDFNNVAELGAMPYPSSVLWSGALIAPRDGLYGFAIVADDTGWIAIDGKMVVADTGYTPRVQGTGTAELLAGRHRIIVGERNVEGDAYAHLYWQTPGSAVEVVPTEALIPDGFDPGNAK